MLVNMYLKISLRLPIWISKFGILKFGRNTQEFKQKIKLLPKAMIFLWGLQQLPLQAQVPLHDAEKPMAGECDKYASELVSHSFLAIEHLCVTSGNFSEAQTIYRRFLGGHEIRLLLLSDALLPIVSVDEFAKLKSNETDKSKLAHELSADLMVIWLDDARLWQEQLDHIDDGWFGGRQK